MEKVAVAHVARERARRRNRIIWTAIAAVVVVTLTIGGLLVQSNTPDNVNVAPPTTEATTPPTSPPPTTAGPSTTVRAAPTSCTGLTDPLPEGAPAMPLVAGPAPTELATKDLTVGEGAEVTKTSKANIDYVGVNCSGKIFDTSFKEGAQPFDADMTGGVIEGWLQGIPGMKEGGVRLLSIPPGLAYKDQARSELIPANEPLFFLVRVNSVS